MGRGSLAGDVTSGVNVATVLACLLLKIRKERLLNLNLLTPQMQRAMP
jgi:hypothetical protein